MAELVGVVSSAITFATFAVQVSKSVQTLKGYWDSIRDAPDDLKWLLREVEMLGSIIADVDKDLSQGSVPLGLRDSQHVTQSLHLCEEAVECLESLCKDLLQGIGSSSRMRRSYQAAKIILHERRIEKHISKLHSVVRLLMLSQQCYIRAVIQVQPSLIAEEIRNLGVASSHTLIAEHVSAPHLGASKLQKGQFRPHKGRFFWLLRAPHWMTSRVLEISGMKTLSGWDWSFRTYSEVRWASDFDCDLREGRIENIQHRFASGELSPFFRVQGSGRSLLHYAVCAGRNNQMVDFLLEQGVDPSIEGGLSTSKTPLRLVLEIGRQAASNKLYPLLPYLRCLLHHSQHLVYDNAEEAVNGILSEFHGTSEEFRFLQQHCCPTFYQMPRWARIKVAAQIVCDANHSYYAEEANNTPDLIKTVLSKDILEVKTFQAKFTLPFTPKETTLMHFLVHGPYLVRTAEIEGDTIYITGDWDEETDVEIWAPKKVKSVSFNGSKLKITKSKHGTLVGPFLMAGRSGKSKFNCNRLETSTLAAN
ncbi:hypothetical protein ABOM_005031 [Aspergillus bombycis]|uniref:Beta-galactosidase domain-containing protein n=1 Tax=Aspergillus bombycis TaxID=109264 RepID=A0A1F8A646_9EURO|nr:hypothetical protein ABOM_005031 [Aspergillus bombycis]OGM46859.1 hypothetical protein ABOM_005031 [Aspergillus bombycis]